MALDVGRRVRTAQDLRAVDIAREHERAEEAAVNGI
jgi:hypothetical protein